MHTSRKARCLVLVTCLQSFSIAAAHAQSGPPDPVGRVQLPPVVVTAQKEPADPQTLPVSVTAVSRETLADADITWIRDAGIYAPNTQFTDFTARKLSNPRFRGVGSSPANPAITTYLDGVPQLHANASSINLMDVEQLEFVRGPQSALFGRNTLAGVINVASVRPSLSAWTGRAWMPLANAGSREFRATASGPLTAGRVGVSGAVAYARRDGFTRNTVTGNDLDERSAFTGKGQVLWTPSSLWEARVLVYGERARDGDYALNDLATVRSTPFEVSRDFEGHTDRNVVGTTVIARRMGSRIAVSSTTGFVNWSTLDETDLDYTRLPLVTRTNEEDAFQFTQEVRVASAPTATWRLSEDVPVRWQGGIFLFTQNYEQDAVNTIGARVLSPLIPFPVRQHSPQATLDDAGFGLYGQATATFVQRLDVTVGARFDHESKEALLNTFLEPALAPRTEVDADDGFSNVSPQFSVAFRLRPDAMVYGSVSRGFKAGGFNPVSPAGFESYGEEQRWNLEGGVKTTWAGGRVVANAAVFHIDWDDLQLNAPDPRVPAQFYIANVGRASSQGVEVELNAQAAPGVNVFGALGIVDASFKSGSISSGVNVGGNEIPNTPDFTATVGTQIARAINSDYTGYGRFEVATYGAFKYDDLNTAGQDSFALSNIRGGVRRGRIFVEGWLRNAFDTKYVPVAFAFDPQLAPSGFLGEPGAPRTFGVTAGVTF